MDLNSGRQRAHMTRLTQTRSGCAAATKDFGTFCIELLEAEIQFMNGSWEPQLKEMCIIRQTIRYLVFQCITIYYTLF